jgi:regulator of protease activity HflC (stomatin/prohibitin superfamily)
MEPLLFIGLAAIGYLIGSIKIINQGNEAIVERLGRFNRLLKPGLHHVFPLIETVLVESTRERLLDTEPKPAITKDNVSLDVDAIVYWKILNVKKSYYAVQDLEEALKNLVLSSLRSEVGSMSLQETISSQNQINQMLARQLDEATEDWGVQIIRVEVQEITLPKTMREALELERAAASRRSAAISETEGTVESIRLIANALQAQNNTQAILKYLLAQRYVDANFKLGDSANSKIVFMDPKALTEAVTELMANEGFEGPDISTSTHNPGRL